jgi:small-conductance mechanosensitive channel
MEYNLIGSLEQSMNALWIEVMQYLPQLAVALLVLIIGWLAGGILGSVVRKLFKRLHLDDALDKAGVDELSKKAGYTFKPARFAGELVKWFVILVFVVVAFDILGLEEVTTFMREVVLGYLPLVFAAVLILFAGAIIAGIAKTATMGIVRSGGGKSPELFGKIAYYLVLGFTVMAVLNQLQIADELVETLFMGIVFALSLGAGLAFGLGGKDAAGRYIDDFAKKHHH